MPSVAVKEVSTPATSKPTALSELIDVGERTLDHIAALCRDDCNRLVVVLSARTADALSRIFAPIAEKHVNLALAAEEGLSVRWRGDEPFEMQVSDFDLDMSWLDDAAPLIEYYTERTPGSVVEKKESGLAWHYRDCDLNHGAWQARCGCCLQGCCCGACAAAGGCCMPRTGVGTRCPAVVVDGLC